MTKCHIVGNHMSRLNYVEGRNYYYSLQRSYSRLLADDYCKFGNFREGFNSRNLKIKPSRNSEITLSFTDGGKSCPCREFLTLQICLLTLFAKTKFSRKFPNLHYRKFLSNSCQSSVYKIRLLSAY